MTKTQPLRSRFAHRRFGMHGGTQGMEPEMIKNDKFLGPLQVLRSELVYPSRITFTVMIGYTLNRERSYIPSISQL